MKIFHRCIRDEGFGQTHTEMVRHECSISRILTTAYGYCYAVTGYLLFRFFVNPAQEHIRQDIRLAHCLRCSIVGDPTLVENVRAVGDI